MILNDAEFGEIIIRKNALAKSLKFSISTSGRLQVTAPKNFSIKSILLSLNQNRETIKSKLPLKDPKSQSARDAKKRLLAKQAKDFLPYRLAFLAKKFGYHYDKHKLSHAGTLWGSCTHKKTGVLKHETIISLNIGLMKLPQTLIDYVIIHELAHLNHPDHSKAFWTEVKQHDKDYKTHRKLLKNYHPGV